MGLYLFLLLAAIIIAAVMVILHCRRRAQMGDEDIEMWGTQRTARGWYMMIVRAKFGGPHWCEAFVWSPTRLILGVRRIHPHQDF
eukprot:1393700-Amorphochlora_amoeboformis.AAC.1